METTIETDLNKKVIETRIDTRKRIHMCIVCGKESTREHDFIVLAYGNGYQQTATTFCNECAVDVATVLQQAHVHNAVQIARSIAKSTPKPKPPTNPAFDHIKLSDVRSVYSGKANSCICGCSGKHFYASAHKDESGTERGYDVDDDEVSDKMIKRVFNIVATSEHVRIEGNEYAETTVNDRLYVIYFTNAFSASK